jgi:hypothetical protein
MVQFGPVLEPFLENQELNHSDLLELQTRKAVQFAQKVSGLAVQT